MVGIEHSGKADQLLLASGGSDHAYIFSVAISWGNEMNFSLYANKAGFCSDGDLRVLLYYRFCIHVSNHNTKHNRA